MLGWAEGVPAGSAGPRRSPAPIRRPGAGSLQRGAAAALAAAKVRENLGYRARVAGRHLKEEYSFTKNSQQTCLKKLAFVHITEKKLPGTNF
jgi:hypothetical protein